MHALQADGAMVLLAELWSSQFNEKIKLMLCNMDFSLAVLDANPACSRLCFHTPTDKRTCLLLGRRCSPCCRAWRRPSGCSSRRCRRRRRSGTRREAGGSRTDSSGNLHPLWKRHCSSSSSNAGSSSRSNTRSNTSASCRNSSWRSCRATARSSTAGSNSNSSSRWPACVC